MAQPAPLAPNEGQRLERLLSLGVLDTEAEPLFDALTRAASLLTGAPISVLTLVDERRQWFKSSVGLEGVKETPRDVAFCSYTILGDELFVVPDALSDPRFVDNPLVTDAPHIRFYAGAPITLDDGLRMGALCVIDREPRQLSPRDAAILRELAAGAQLARHRVDLIEARAAGALGPLVGATGGEASTLQGILERGRFVGAREQRDDTGDTGGEAESDPETLAAGRCEHGGPAPH